jgi:hypothetical protein
MRTCSAMPLSAHMLLPNKEFNSGTESAGLNRRHAPDSAERPRLKLVEFTSTR